MRVFIDETAWINLIDPSQSRYHEARQFFNNGLSNDFKFYTSNIAIGNAISALKNSAGPQVAFKFYDTVEEAYMGAYLRIMWIGRRTQKEAIRLMRKYPHLALDLYDFANVVLMNRRHIPTIFTFIDAYEKLGLKVVPELSEVRNGFT